MQSANYRCAYCGISRMELGANVFVSHMLEVLGGAPFKLVSHIKTEYVSYSRIICDGTLTPSC